MNARAQTLLWVAQRASAAVLALCVVVHLATMIYAIRGGLSAAEICQTYGMSERDYDTTRKRMRRALLRADFDWS